MRYLHRLTQNEIVVPLMNAVMRQPDLWSDDDIQLRTAASDILCADHEDSAKLPGAKQIAIRLMQFVGGVQLGGVKVSRVQAGHKIAPHIDAGKYGEFYSSYIIVLLGLPGFLFTCGDETVTMGTGDIWWLDRKAEQSAKNNSADDCICLNVDIRIDP